MSTIGQIRKNGIGVIFLKDHRVWVIVNDPKGERAEVIDPNEVYLNRNDSDDRKYRTYRWDDGITVEPIADWVKADFNTRYKAQYREIQKHFGIQQFRFLTAVKK